MSDAVGMGNSGVGTSPTLSNGSLLRYVLCFYVQSRGKTDYHSNRRKWQLSISRHDFPAPTRAT